MKLNSKYFDSIRVKPGKKSSAKPEVPGCQWDDCDKPGTHKAPVGRGREGEYFRFCVDHVRQYNKSYNYFSGLEDGDVAQYQKDALTGNRPTWTMGTNGDAKFIPRPESARSGSASYYNRLRNPHGFAGGAGRARADQTRQRKLKTLEKKAFDTLGLDDGATELEIKARYKELVKMHHPDSNGGDRKSEDRFRDVVQAYRLLKQAGFC